MCFQEVKKYFFTFQKGLALCIGLAMPNFENKNFKESSKITQSSCAFKKLKNVVKKTFFFQEGCGFVYLTCHGQF